MYSDYGSVAIKPRLGASLAIIFGYRLQDKKRGLTEVKPLLANYIKFDKNV